LGVSATLLALSSVLTSVTVANAATFNFSFSNEDGPVNGTVSGTITLPDGNGTFPASNITVTSAPAALGYTLPFNVFAGLPNIIQNTFTVVGGMINNAVSVFGAQNDSTLGSFAFNFPTFGTLASILDNGSPSSGVLDSDNSTLVYSSNAPATTPEPTSVITLIGIGVLGVASKLKKKA